MTTKQNHGDNYSCASTNPNTTTTSSTTTTITEQEHKHQYIPHNQYYNNNTNNDTPEPGVLSPEDGERMREAYEDNIGRPMTLAVASMIEKALAHGLTVDEIIMAIEETGFARDPSPWYLRAILEHWAATGVTVSKARHEIRANRGVRWWRGPDMHKDW